MTGAALVVQGDALRLPLPDNSIDAIATDPPYGLEFMGKDWDHLGPKRQGNPFDPRKGITKDSSSEPRAPDNPWQKEASGYGAPKRMPKCRRCGKWRYNGHKPSQCSCPAPDWVVDTSSYPQAMQRWHEQWATEALRVLKPGGWLLACGGTRTFHRLVSGVEDAGFEIRDTIAWMHGQGFPKSLNVSDSATRSIPPDIRCSCAQRSTDTASSSPAGYPSHHGSDGEQPRLAAADGLPSAPSPADAPGRTHAGLPLDGQGAGPASNGLGGGTGHPSTEGSPAPTPLPSEGSPASGSARSGSRTSTSPDAATEPHRTDPRRPDTSSLDGASPWRNKYISACSVCGGAKVQPGLGTALKPAIEFITVARKPLAGSVAQNVLTFGTGALNIDATRVGTEVRENPAAGNKPGGASLNMSVTGMPEDALPRTATGRWPSNVALVHDPGCVPVGVRKVRGITGGSRGNGHIYVGGKGLTAEPGAPVHDYADPDGTETVTAWDCQPDCPVRLLDAQSGERQSGLIKAGSQRAGLGYHGANGGPVAAASYGDQGGASRFYPTFQAESRLFYTAKAPRNERVTIDGDSHATVKPLALMRWLVRLVTPPGGLILDPFGGSGTTGEAAMLEGFTCLVLDKDPASCAKAKVRAHPHVRRRTVVTGPLAVPEQGSLL